MSAGCVRRFTIHTHKKGLDLDKSLQSSGAPVVWHQCVHYHLFWELCALWFCGLWPKQNLTLRSSSSWNLHFAFMLRGHAAVDIYINVK